MPKFENTKMNRIQKFGFQESLIMIGLVIYAIIILYPLLWMIISSMKGYNEIYNDVWGLPSEWLINNYAEAWSRGISDYFVNSIIVTVITVVTVLIIGSMAAYALARFRSRFIDLALIVIIGGMMMNPEVAIIPLYELLSNFNLVDTRLALILPYIAFRLPICVLLLRSYFLGVPKEVSESAVMDGCSEFGIYLRIFLPMSIPIMITTVVLTSFYAWNEFLFATVFISTEELKTIPSGLMNFRDALQTNWGVLLAGMVIASLPMIVLLIFLQRYLVRGLSEGAVKG